MSILDDFAGVLSTEEIEKIKASPALRTRLEKGDELLTYYTEGETPTVETKKPLVRTEVSAETSDLASITKTLGELTTKLGNVVTKDDLDKTLKEKSSEFVNAAVGRALKQTVEMSRVERRHAKDFPGEELDADKFEAWANEQMNAGRSFASITSAYEEYTMKPRLKVEAQAEAREDLKKKNAENQGAQVPGVTPPSSKSPIATFMRRGKEADGENKTAVDRAGAALSARRASQSEA